MASLNQAVDWLQCARIVIEQLVPGCSTLSNLPPVEDTYATDVANIPFEEYEYGLIRVIGQHTIPFIRADCNADGSLNIADAIVLHGYLFLGADAPSCLNCDDYDTI